MQLKPIMFLDIDDTCLSFNREHLEKLFPDKSLISVPAAPGLPEFFRFARENFEVRWLTSWCGGTKMDANSAQILGPAFGVTPKEITDIASVPWMRFANKAAGVLAQPDIRLRHWIWVEDWILEEEKQLLKKNGFLNRWFNVNTTKTPLALAMFHAQLKKGVHE